MKQVLLELDDDTALQLERIAPARSRRRSEFIRAAIRSAIWAEQERATELAYRRTPDDEPAYFDPTVWEVREPSPTPRAPARKGRKR
jgi:hypothetical protein